MNAERAWQVVLEQLSDEMPRSAYDSWVRPARLHSFVENTFTIAAADAYAREWLSQRMTALMSRILAGCVGHDVQVQFIVAGAENTKAEPQVPDERPHSAVKPVAGLHDSLHLEAARHSLRDLFVKPEREIAIPGYFRRWIPYLGPTLAWTVVGFRQLFYLSAGCHPRDGSEFTATSAQLVRWCGSARSTFWENLKDPRLGWFLTPITQTQRWVPDAETGQPRQKPNRYRFRVAMPLTPGDAESLSAWLQHAGIRSDPLSAIQAALAAPPASILPDLPPPPGDEISNLTPNPRSVHEVIHQECGRLPRRTFSQVNKLADELEAHLIPKNDLIFVTWYFLQNWVSELGAGAAWFVTLLRDRCYFARSGGENRREVWIQGGNAEICRMLGLTREKTISEWLPPVFSRPGKDGTDRARRKEQTRQRMARFVERTDHRPSSEGGTAWLFRVADYGLEPLLPEHEQAYEMLLSVVGEFLESGDNHTIDSLLSDLSRARNGLSDYKTGRVSDSQLNLSRRVSDSKDHLSGRDSDSLVDNQGAMWTNGGARYGLILKHLVNTGIRSESLAETINRIEHLVMGNGKPLFEDPLVVVGDEWDSGRLLERMNIGVRRKILALGSSGREIVSHILYICGEEGHSLKDGKGYLAGILMENPKEGAGGIYDELASLTPIRLAELVRLSQGREVEVQRTGEAKWDIWAGAAGLSGIKQLCVYLGISG